MGEPSDQRVQPGADPAPGGREDFAARFASSYRVLWLLAAGLIGDRGQADDIVQDAAVIGLTKYHQFDPHTPGSSFTSWMAQIIRFVVLNQARKAHGRRTSAVDPALIDGLPERGGSGSRDGNEREFQLSNGQLPPDQSRFDDQVVRALQSVSETARACLLLRAVEGLEYSEIARILGIPPGTAMSHVHRTRIALRERLASMRPRITRITPDPTDKEVHQP